MRATRLQTALISLAAICGMSGCQRGDRCAESLCPVHDAAVVDAKSEDAGCASTAYQFDQKRICIVGDAAIPVCFLGSGGGKGDVTVCILSPDGTIYYRWEGNDETPHSETPGWRFRVSSGGSNVATDGSILTPDEVAACDRILIPGLEACHP